MSYRDDDIHIPVGKILGGIVLFFVLLYLLGMAAFGVRVMTAGIVGRGEAHIQIQSGSNRIVQYDHFFNLCASVQQAEAGIDAQTDLLESTSDSNEQARIKTNIAALQMTRSNGVFQYNADASKEYTQGQFRDSSLPYQLSEEPYKAGGTKTTCAV